MGLLVAPLVKSYEFFEDSKTIYPEYKFNCQKYWRENKDKYIIYKASKEGVRKIYDSEITDISEKLNIAINLMQDEITDDVLVSGGHTVIDLSNRLNVGEEAVKSTDFTLKLISRIQEKIGKKAKFLIQLNDLYMENDSEKSETVVPNKYREQALKPYVIPSKINHILHKYSVKLNREISLHYCSEKNLADRFKRHIKSQKKSNSELFSHVVTENVEIWNMIIDNETIPVLVNDKPNCVAANAAMLRAIRYKIDNRKQKDHFTSYVGVFPLCSIKNVIDGYKVANKFYDLNLPSYYIFTGASCF